MRDKTKAVAVKDIINDLLEKQKPAKKSLAAKIINNWSEIVGEKAVRFCRPVAIKNKTLMINVSNSAWLHQLTLSKKQILADIEKFAGDSRIIDIRFKIGN